MPSARILDTSVVYDFSEPPASGRDQAGHRYSDPNYRDLCGAGAASVVLAFAGNDPAWKPNQGSAGLMSFIEPVGSAVRVATSWKAEFPGDQGRAYMLYLAEKVKPKTLGRTGLVRFSATIGAKGSSVDGTYLPDEVKVLNWESTALTSVTGYFVGQSWSSSRSVFDRELSQEIGGDGIPALVAVLTAGVGTDGRRWSLPSWSYAVPHWIAVVGYDQNNYYYIDTCWGSTGCGGKDLPASAARLGYWTVSKPVLYEAMQAQRFGFVAPTVG